MPKPLVVFDCVVFVQSLISKSGPAVTCIERFRKGDFSLAISKDTLAEVREVLSRSKLREDFPLLTEEKAVWLIELLLYKGKLFQKVPRRFEFQRDPDDEPYINLAVEAGADFLNQSQQEWDTQATSFKLSGWCNLDNSASTSG